MLNAAVVPPREIASEQTNVATTHPADVIGLKSLCVQNYCDKHGEPLSPAEEDEQDRVEYDLDRKMRLFYRCYSQHSHL